MRCNAWECGTGLDEIITLPGDPSNNSVLSATGVSGGIRVAWTYPTTNPYGIAYVKLYRGTNGVFANAILLTNTSAGYYLDVIAESDLKEYFYWIQLVSVNGTELPLIGPASAIPLSGIYETMQYLTGKIDSGYLAKSLRDDLDRITGLASDLDAEKSQNLLRHQVVSEALEASAAANGQAFTYIAHETEERKSATEAIVEQVDFLFASINNTQAALLEEKTIRATQDGALSSKVDQAEVAFQNQFAAVKQTTEAKFALVDGKIASLGALWNVQLTVNNLVGGFGVYNDGRTVEAGFDLDRFWVGRTNADKVKPFIIDSGVVYIDDARIRKLTFTKLRDETGDFLVENGRLKAKYIQAEKLVVDWGQITNVKIVNAHIGTAAVDTLNIAGNAVTIPLYAEGGTGRSGAQTASGDFTSGSVILTVKVITQPYSYPVYIRRNGTIIRTLEANKSMDEEGQTVHWVDEFMTFKDTPGAAAYYSITCGGAAYFNFTQITALGCKR